MLACSIDGAVCPPNEAMIPVNDHGLLYGDGVFEGLRFYNNQIFRLPQHLDRLSDSARALSLRLPMSNDALTSALYQAIDAAGAENGYIRLIVTRGSGPMGLDPTLCVAPRTIIIVDKLVMVAPEKLVTGVDTIISSVRRLASDQLDARIKSLNYLNQILARLEAHAAGADEAIMLNNEGRVAEGSADNIFIMKNGELLTPPTTEGALDGVTRGAIIDVAKSLGIPFRETPLGPWDLFTADECFLSGTGAELIPVATISGRKIGESTQVFASLSKGFRTLIKLETRGALTAV